MRPQRARTQIRRLLALTVAILAAASLGAIERPNVITVFIDDMGWSDLSCYGGRQVETQSIDRLAAEGLRFSNFYVNSPICSPSRAALTTGQYPHRWRITSYLARRRLNRRRGVAQWLDPAAPVLARELQRAGYATGHFGKWHMGGQRDVGNAPLIGEYGFDRSLTNFEGLGPRILPLKDAYDGEPARPHDLGSAELGRGPIRWEDRSVITASFVRAAIAFIDEATAAGKPFYVNVWPDDVHSPFFPPRELRQATDGTKRSLYYAVLVAMDRQLGALFDRVRDDENLRTSTLILVASDNGHEDGAGSSDPLRGAKTWLYEGGIRSPLIVWGPGLLADGVAGTVNEKSILCALDLNASLYEITGVNPPRGFELDGEQLAGTLLGHERRGREAPIFWRRPPDRPGTQTQPNPDLAVRDGRWKLLVSYDGARPELYDLEADISESQNLAGQHPDVVDRLREAALEWNRKLPIDAGDPRFEGAGPRGSLPPGQFVNPIGEGADPWITRDADENRYLWCFSVGNRGIAIHTSDRLTSLGRRHVVWRAPETGPVSREIWAPELHFLDGHWHIYFAASDGRNENHLAYVLRSRSRDPLGAYELHGPFATGEGADGRSPNIWAIDMTVLDHRGRRYAIWSGWDAPGTDHQYLYIAPMRSPVELGAPRVRLSANDSHLWERVEPRLDARGLNEAPQVFRSPQRSSGETSRTVLYYSCGASWLPTYKLGALDLVGDNPLDPEAWVKRNRPVFESTGETFGVGHSCFIDSPDGSEWWHVFHAKRDRRPGWRRAVFVQPFRLDERGLPILGTPLPAGDPLKRPSGERIASLDLPYHSALKAADHIADWSYYGHHQFIEISGRGLLLGRRPERAVNGYPSGEKVVLDRELPDDLVAEVSLDFLGDADARGAGMLLRVSGASIGYDAHRGYFAGVNPRTGHVVLGRADGETWTELARASAVIDASSTHRLRVDVKGAEIRVTLDGERKLTATDATYGSGTVGLRVFHTRALFTDLRLLQPRDTG